MKFPKKIYTKMCKDSDGSYFLDANENPKKMEDGKVAIYKFEKTVTKTTKTIVK